jgi:hypothetical protein
MTGPQELSHQIKHQSAQQDGGFAPFTFGHIATYDPKQGVRLYIPSMRDEDDNPSLSSWMPLSSMFAGNGWGVQVAPMGGATAQNPTAGELCVIGVLSPQRGLMAALCSIYNTVNLPPFPDLKAGEFGMMSKKGSFMRFHDTGDVEFNLPVGNLIATVATGNLVASAPQGTASVTAPIISMGNGGVLQPVKLANNAPSIVLMAE